LLGQCSRTELSLAWGTRLVWVRGAGSTVPAGEVGLVSAPRLRRAPVQPALGDPAWAGGWAGGPTEVPANPHHAVTLCSAALPGFWVRETYLPTPSSWRAGEPNGVFARGGITLPGRGCSWGRRSG